MTRHRLFSLLVVTALVGLLLPFGFGEAHIVTKTLTQTLVTGQLADGSTFRGRLTVRELTIDEDGHLTATGVLTGKVTTAPGTATTIAPRPFTALASLLDLRGTCTTVVLDLAPIVLTPLEQEVTLMPVILGLQDTVQHEHLLRTTLCALARLQE